MGIRSAAKALILSERKLLLNRCNDSKNGDYYALPGGGQNVYESITDALVRECLEETGYEVQPIRLVALCETICDDEEFRARYPEYAHKMFHIFLCELKCAERRTPTEIDSMQTGVEWVHIERLTDIRLMPRLLGDYISKVLEGIAPIFLGSEHIPFNHG